MSCQQACRVSLRMDAETGSLRVTCTTANGNLWKNVLVTWFASLLQAPSCPPSTPPAALCGLGLQQDIPQGPSLSAAFEQ